MTQEPMSSIALSIIIALFEPIASRSLPFVVNLRPNTPGNKDGDIAKSI